MTPSLSFCAGPSRLQESEGNPKCTVRPGGDGVYCRHDEWMEEEICQDRPHGFGVEEEREHLVDVQQSAEFTEQAASLWLCSCSESFHTSGEMWVAQGEDIVRQENQTDSFLLVIG